MDLQHLKVFYEVAKRGSVSAAAKALRITQPSISRSVQNLEGSLNLKLFLRHSKGVTLTEEGQRVYARCHTIFHECAAIESLPVHAGQPLRIAASENLCIHVFPKIFADFLNPAEPLPIELLSGSAEEVIKAVMNGHADYGYCYHPSKVPGLSCTAVASVEFWMIVSSKHFKKKMTAKDLRERSFVGSFLKHYQGPYAAKSLLSEAGLDVEAIHQCNSQESQVSMVESGLGYSLIPWFVVQEKIKKGLLSKIPMKRPLKTPLFRIASVSDKFEIRGQIEIALKRLVEC